MTEIGGPHGQGYQHQSDSQRKEKRLKKDKQAGAPTVTAQRSRGFLLQPFGWALRVEYSNKLKTYCGC